MLYLVPFKAEHVLKMKLQINQKWIEKYISVETLKTLENEWAVTVMENGKPVTCAGPVIYWANRALMWSFIGTGITKQNFLEMHYIAKEYLDGLPIRRLEAAINLSFTAAHRWIKALGFKMEAPCMKAFQIDGSDCALYARVKK